MTKKRYSKDQIIKKLEEVEAELACGYKTGEVCRKLGIVERTYYRWRSKYGTRRTGRIKMEQTLTDQALDLSMLRELFPSDF